MSKNKSHFRLPLTLLGLLSISSHINASSSNTFTGLFSASSTGFYKPNENIISSRHQQDIRLMLDGETKNTNYEIHVLSTSDQSENMIFKAPDYSSTFQYNTLKHEYFNRQQATTNYAAYTQIDRMNIKANFASLDFRLGRQAISWGAGRFWQPTDVFGAFDANQLIRDYKPGIDALDLSYYPDAFSSLNMVYILSDDNQPNIGLRYTQPINEKAYLSVITAQVQKNTIVGGSLETDWHNAGLWLEGTMLSSTERSTQFYTVAGFDYRFANEWLITTEVYYNSNGVNQISDFSALVSDRLFQAGLLKQLSRQLLGISLQKNITPLININYLLINAFLTGKTLENSALNQLSITYSISDESELWLTLLSTTGKEMDKYGIPQSEFGHIPRLLSFLVRVYF